MITVKQGRTALWKAVKTAEDPYDPVVLETINLVQERFYTMGKWKGSYVEVQLTEYDGVVTLPRQCQSMLFYRQNNWPTGIKNQWFEWQNWGVGYRDPDGRCNLCEAFDQGPGFCSFRDFSSPRKLRVKALDADDSTITVTFQGTDSDGRRIYTTDVQATHPINGEQVTCVAGIGDTTYTFEKFTSFIKPVTHGYVEVWTINPDDSSDETLIAVYEPGETVPDYRRYKVGKIGDNTTIWGLCKLKFVPLASEQDMIIPSNIGALKNGILALQLEDSGSGPQDTEYYWGKAFEILNAELAQERGGAKAPPVINFGSMGQCKVLNIY